MNKLNVLSAMRLGGGSGSHNNFDDKKIRSVNNLPKVQSLDSRMMNNILPSKSTKKKSGLQLAVQKQEENIKKHGTKLDGIEEANINENDEDSVDSSGDDDKKGSSNSNSDSSGESSIDMDGEDEDKLYA